MRLRPPNRPGGPSTRHRTVDSSIVAPPKRKTGGRTTAPGTTSGRAPGRVEGTAEETHEHDYTSGRYTAPTTHTTDMSPQWVPLLMLGLFILGAVAIMIRYLAWDSNVPMLIGIAAILGGLGVATRWR